MSSGFWFISIVLVVTIGLLIYHKGNPVKFFKTKQGKDAAAGIAIVLTVLVGVVLLGGCSHGRFAKDAGIFGGIEYTKKLSPMCVPGADDRGTSNVGAYFSVWESNDERTSIQLRYTHHSCFVGEDDQTYDAFGFHAVRKVWAR